MCTHNREDLGSFLNCSSPLFLETGPHTLNTSHSLNTPTHTHTLLYIDEYQRILCKRVLSAATFTYRIISPAQTSLPIKLWLINLCMSCWDPLVFCPMPGPAVLIYSHSPPSPGLLSGLWGSEIRSLCLHNRRFTN